MMSPPAGGGLRAPRRGRLSAPGTKMFTSFEAVRRFHDTREISVRKVRIRMKAETIGQKVKSEKELKIRFSKVIAPVRYSKKTRCGSVPGTKGRTLRELVTRPGLVSAVYFPLDCDEKRVRTIVRRDVEKMSGIILAERGVKPELGR